MVPYPFTNYYSYNYPLRWYYDYLEVTYKGRDRIARVVYWEAES